MQGVFVFTMYTIRLVEDVYNRSEVECLENYLPPVIFAHDRSKSVLQHSLNTFFYNSSFIICVFKPIYICFVMGTVLVLSKLKK